LKNVEKCCAAEKLRPIEASTPQWSEARTKRGVLRKAGTLLIEKPMLAFSIKKSKNSISHKPDSVFCGKPQKAIIYLAATLLLQSCCLPSFVIRRYVYEQHTFCTGQKQKFTWHYSIQSLPIIIVTNNYCELLPHIFTFLPT
jgi:hypothetical protein